MVLTRRQRKSGINVSPAVVPEKKEIAKKNKFKKKDISPAKATPTNEETNDPRVTSPVKSDDEIIKPRISTPKKDLSKATPRKEAHGKVQSEKKTQGKKMTGKVDTSDFKNTSNSKKSNLKKLNKPKKYDVEDGKEPVDINNSKELSTSNFDISKSSDEMDPDEECDSKNEDMGTDIASEDDVSSKLEGSNIHVLSPQSLKLVEDLSDDEAPVSMTFDMGKETALETLHQAFKESIKIKSKKKEKRRAHYTMMKEQAKKKMKRCEELDRNRLPEAVLKHVTIETNDRPKHSEQMLNEIDREDEDFLDDDDEGDELFGSEADDDYVKEKQGFQIVPLQKFSKRPVVKSMAASNFLKEQLYGKRVPRVSAPSHMSMLLKKSRQPGVNFKVKGLPVTKKERNQKKNNWANLIK